MELAPGDGVVQRLRRGGNDAHVHLASLAPAGAGHAALLQHPGHPGLELRRERAHLVHEQRAPLGQLEESGVFGRRARHGSGHAAEQLGLEQLPGMAPQLITVKPPSLRALRRWMARARTSLPVPGSPVSRIGVWWRATRLAMSRMSRIAR